VNKRLSYHLYLRIML